MGVTTLLHGTWGGRSTEPMTGHQAKIAPSPLSLHAAHRIQEALRASGIVADVHDGYGLALVSVWVGLVVWCDGERYWWRTGWDAERKRAIYAWHSTTEPERAARRVAFRYAGLRGRHPNSELITELDSAHPTG